MSMLQRVRNLWRRERVDVEIEEELRSHLEMAAEDAERAGMSPEEARRGCDSGIWVHTGARARGGCSANAGGTAPGCAIRIAADAQGAGIFGGGDRDSRARDRREYDGIQHCGCGYAATTAVCTSATAGGG
jgi:hypothetical protein